MIYFHLLYKTVINLAQKQPHKQVIKKMLVMMVKSYKGGDTSKAPFKEDKELIRSSNPFLF